MSLKDSIIFNDSIVNINITKHRLTYLEYILNLKLYMVNLSHEMMKLQKNLFDLSLNDTNEPDSYIYFQSEDLMGSLIEPIDIVNQLIEREMKSYGKVFKQVLKTKS